MDVVDALQCEFEHRVADIRDFDAMVELHDAHLRSISTQCLIAQDEQRAALKRVLASVLVFCGQLQRAYVSTSRDYSQAEKAYQVQK